MKSKIAIEAIQGKKTITEIASAYSVHPHQVIRWKNRLLNEAPGVFSDKRFKNVEIKLDTNSIKVSQLRVELDWIKSKYQALLPLVSKKTLY